MPRAGAVPARFKSAERSVSVEPSYINHDTHTPSGSPMSSLPLELWWNILDSLDNNSLSAYCQACRAWYSIGNLTLWGRIEKLSELSSRLVSKKALLSIDGILRPPSSPETTNFNQLDIDWSSELSRNILSS
ncbi:hypothetical protein FS749_001134 [Ceratobasidium sp. UAMH 11750]|nr:hypothetical protein FS749_001134 [Ceratobasidium sp. UAMH 11750]